MIITDSLAKNIIKDMKEIIDQDLNFIDRDGFIIASTDESREQSYHEGGKIVAETGRDLIVNNDDEYIGTKKGINMPVYLNGNIVGVVGITGKKDEVGHFGRIILKMTEILVKEAYIKDLKVIEKDKQRIIIQELLTNHGSSRVVKKFNIKEIKDRIAIVSNIIGDGDISSELQNKIYYLYYDILSDRDSLFTQVDRYTIIVLEYLDEDDLLNIINRIHKAIYKEYRLKTIFGIGNKFTNIKDVNLSFENAKLALEFFDFEFINYEKSKIYKDYRDLDIEFILSGIDKEDSEKFTSKILGGLDKEELILFNKLILSYGKHNGSINLIADELFLHKNTIQYNIKKIYEKVGYDMRNYNDYLILKMAYLLSITDIVL